MEAHNKAQSDEAGLWYMPTQVLHLAGGEYLLKPGKPVLRARAKQVAKWCGITQENLTQLAECGFIRCVRPGPGLLLYYPAEVEAFLQKTEDDPDFWLKVKKDANFIATRRGYRLRQDGE